MREEDFAQHQWCVTNRQWYRVGGDLSGACPTCREQVWRERQEGRLPTQLEEALGKEEPVTASDWRRDLGDSAHNFEFVVWPAIAEACGGGHLKLVETHPGGVNPELDMLGGIDAYQVLPNGLMRPLASRVQFEVDYRTFTIRLRRDTGSATEYAKRRLAIAAGDASFPTLTIHAYVTQRQHGQLLSAAVARTVDLYKYMSDVRRLPAPRRTSNATFLYLCWDCCLTMGFEFPVVVGVGDGSARHLSHGQFDTIAGRLNEQAALLAERRAQAKAPAGRVGYTAYLGVLAEEMKAAHVEVWGHPEPPGPWEGR